MRRALAVLVLTGALLAAAGCGGASEEDLEALLEEIRSDVMRQALERSGGVRTQAAELLRMSFRSFRYYARKAGLTGAQD